jgi:hypothetical protein
MKLPITHELGKDGRWKMEERRRKPGGVASSRALNSNTDVQIIK